MTTVYYRFVCKRDTRANFLAAGTVLLQGEWAVETDTGGMKMGDGVTAYAALRYRVAEFFAVAGGTANALTADFSPPPVLFDGLLVRVRASLANTTTTPTLNANGGGALTITKNGGAVLAAGDIAANKALLLLYRAADTTWQLLNPASGSSSSGASVLARISLGA